MKKVAEWQKETKNIRVYNDDAKAINQMCLDENISQPDAVRKLLRTFIKTN